MTICTHTVDCGPLGEVDLTVSYKHHAKRNGGRIDPAEPETVTIYWIKIGGTDGVEVDVADDYITDEIIPACIADWNGEAEASAEAHADALREERRLAA